MIPVLVVGSINLDLVFRTTQLPVPGQTLLGGEFSTHPGGKGANQAAAVGALGGRVEFVGCIGDDAEGGVLAEALQRSKVGTERLQVLQGRRSGTACVIVAEDGANMIVVAPGANSDVTPAQVTSALGHFKPKVTLCQLEVPMATVLAAAQSDCFILNPAPAQALPSEIFPRCFVLTPNETELQGLTGIAPTDQATCVTAAHALLDLGVKNVIVTLGAKGCVWVSATGSQHFPAFEVPTVDTVAAGDSFNGGLAHFLASGRELANAIPLANAVGALSTTKHGAMESMPSLDELRGLAGELL